MKYYIAPYAVALIFMTLWVSRGIELHQARAHTKSATELTARAIVVAQQWKSLSNLWEKIATDCLPKERLDTVPKRETLLNL